MCNIQYLTETLFNGFLHCKVCGDNNCLWISNSWSIVSICSAAIGWQHCDIIANHKLGLLSDYTMERLLQAHRLLNKNSIITHKYTIFVSMVALHSPLVRSDFSSTWESVSSSSSCGTAPSSLARGNHSQRSCRPHRTHRCRSPPQLQGKLCLGKLLSAWRWRTPPDCGLLGPPQSRAVVRGRKSYYT